MREADVRIEARGDGWVPIFRTSFETVVAVPPGASGDSSPEMRRALGEARALKQALDLRQGALKQIVQVMIEVQGAFFRDGPEALQPLTQAMIAAKTGFHLSTVSRVLNGLLIEGPNGIIPARHPLRAALGALLDGRPVEAEGAGAAARAAAGRKRKTPAVRRAAFGRLARRGARGVAPGGREIPPRTGLRPGISAAPSRLTPLPFCWSSEPRSHLREHGSFMSGVTRGPGRNGRCNARPPGGVTRGVKQCDNRRPAPVSRPHPQPSAK